jgi:recombinase
VTLYEFSGDGTGLKLLDLDDEDDRALADIKAVFAQLEKAKIKRRVRRAAGARARAGRHHGGQRPYGYDFGERGLRLVPHEAEVVRRIYDLYLGGVGQKAIPRTLHAEGVPTPNGGDKWHQSSVSRILANPLYKGWMRHNGAFLRGNHDPIVDEDMWERAQATSSLRDRRKGGRWPDGSHLLVQADLALRCRDDNAEGPAGGGARALRVLRGSRLPFPSAASWWASRS